MLLASHMVTGGAQGVRTVRSLHRIIFLKYISEHFREGSSTAVSSPSGPESGRLYLSVDRCYGVLGVIVLVGGKLGT